MALQAKKDEGKTREEVLKEREEEKRIVQ